MTKVRRGSDVGASMTTFQVIGVIFMVLFVGPMVTGSGRT